MAISESEKLSTTKETPDERRLRNMNYHSEEFLILGHDDGIYHYLSKESGQIVRLRSDQHVESRLVAVAPANFWEEHYPAKTGANWSAVRDALLRRSHAVGIYNPSCVRGRGGWWDGKHAALHLGDRLIIKGEERPMSSSSGYIYEQAIPIKINYQNPLTTSEANKLRTICDLISWECPNSARYLAGWCAIAPICGALEWRPHVWITGSAGSGKSFILDKIVRRIIGDIGLSVQSATTEAGLRQTLRHDARPVLFDEIEGIDQRAQGRIQTILELARQASTENGARIVKGTTSGEAMTFSIRSVFAFSSIGVSATSRPDESRITVLGINQSNDQSRFQALSRLISDTLTDEYVQRFTARSIRMIPVIRANARIFATAAAVVLKNQRAGDQIGALLAGAYSLFSDREITFQQATDFVAEQDWSDQKPQQEDTDEARCFDRIIQSIIRVETKSGPCMRSIGDLFNIADERTEDEVVSSKIARYAIARHGLWINDNGIIISATHHMIATILKDTEWVKTWGRTLSRLSGASRTSGTFPFGPSRSRGIKIPFPKDVMAKVQPDLVEAYG